jgi:hypothetical protein
MMPTKSALIVLTWRGRPEKDGLDLQRLRAASITYDALNGSCDVAAEARAKDCDLDLALEGIELVMVALTRVLREHRTGKAK